MPSSIRAVAFLFLGPMLAAWLAVALPAQAEESAPAVLDPVSQETLVAIERYLNEIQTLKAEFVQLGPDGERSEGVIYMRRPGRLRVEYAPPVPVLIVSDGLWIHYHDKELGQINDWFIDDTPLGALTTEVVRFGEDLTVTGSAQRDGLVAIALVQGDDPGAGSLTLVFNADPMRLIQWRVTDAQGLVTTVVLRSLETNIRLSPALFVFDDPRRKPTNRR